MLRENTPKLTLFGLLFTQVLMQEKIIEMVFFLNYRQHKKRPKFWIYDNIKAYLKDFFFERLCLAWKVSNENIVFIPFLGSVKLPPKGDHFRPFFLRFCVKKNAGTDPVVGVIYGMKERAFKLAPRSPSVFYGLCWYHGETTEVFFVSVLEIGRTREGMRATACHHGGELDWLLQVKRLDKV